MLVIVTGIPGTGKTTVANKALEKLESEGVKYNMVTYGTVMFEIAKEKGAVEDRDEMRTLDAKLQKEIQSKAAEKIHEMSKDSNVLLDTHCSIKTPKGYLPGLPASILEKLKPDVIVLVEAADEEIDLRRKSDTSRNRDDEGVYGIGLHQDMNRNFAAGYSVVSGASVKVVQNPQGKIDEAAEEMSKVLR